MFPEGDTPNLRNTKSMISEDRVTAYFCTNSNGSAKILIAIIGSSTKTLELIKLSSPHHYFSKRKAWSNTSPFSLWIHEAFILNCDLISMNKVTTIVNNASSHSSIIGPDGIDLKALPGNVSSVHQPMDMGVIRL